MKLTPIDIQQQQFRPAWRGLERREVQAFLDLVAQQVADLTRENGELQSEMRRLKQELHEHRDRENTLREAMLTAQRAIDEIRETAKKEGQLLVTEAEMRAEKILHHAHIRVTKLTDEINELRRQRVRAIEEIRAVLNTHAQLVATYEEATETASDATVTILERVRAPAAPEVQDSAPLRAAR